ncbi:MAG: cell division protein [Candidatus Marinimicrobia bacterium]|nr:cell division protein [Candidatus Neomarinimicrobiota bacterium]|tara:strand:+ start:52772 stop:53194 length:423 start_codon:yes stop_codon:yes gene_type:complete
MKKNNQKHVETIIGEDAVISGEIALKGGAIISGKIEANIKTEGTIRITRTGTIDGDIIADEATIGGALNGNLKANKITLRSGSKVNGDILYKQLIIEEGANFEGRCDLASNEKREEFVDSDKFSEEIRESTIITQSPSNN